LIEVPIDNQIKKWTAVTVPADWETIRNRWESFHALRTFISLTSFGFFRYQFVGGSKAKLNSIRQDDKKIVIL
jgi:hypothetical protein